MPLEEEQLVFRHQEYLPDSLGLFKTKPKKTLHFYQNMNLLHLIELTFNIYAILHKR